MLQIYKKIPENNIDNRISNRWMIELNDSKNYDYIFIS
jgi:hypothetical protein